MSETAPFRRLAQLGIALLAAAAASAAERPPNIVFFLVDDLGWMGSTVYGSRYYETPNMERLAARGMTFTDAYAASPVCSPTRASILTGRHPARLGITNAMGTSPALRRSDPRYPAVGPRYRRTVEPRSRRYLPARELTIAEALKRIGYRTAYVGKWHLGVAESHWPDKQGFETVFHAVPDAGPRSYHSPYGFLAGNLTDGPDGEYLTDRLTDEALSFVETYRDQPFLLHLSHFAPHGPWGHKEEITALFADREDPRGEQENPIMASMIRSIDDSLGRVMLKLDELGLTDNTIVIFFSDNGGDVTGRVGPEELPPTSNVPLRAGKGWLYEGGIRVPLIVSWPAVVAPDSRSAEPVSSVDFFPTLLEATGATATGNTVLDGVSLMPVLAQTGSLEREAIFSFLPHGHASMPPGVAVRRGNWKLIRWFETMPLFPSPVELYDLHQDIGETRNLATAEPAKVAALESLIDDFLEDTEALLPRPNPDFDPAIAALKGWQAVHCRITSDAGIARFEGSGPTPMISNRLATVASRRSPTQLWTGEEAFLRLRARTTDDGHGRVQWRTDSLAQDYRRQVVEFELAPDGRWREINVPLRIEGTLEELQLFLPAHDGAVEIDWIRLEAANAPTGGILQWDFGEDG